MLTFIAFLLRGFGWRGAPIFVSVAVTLIVTKAFTSLISVFGLVERLSESANIKEPVGTAVKIIGLSYLFGISSDIARELGESGIAKAVEMLGRVEILLLALPYFEKIVNIGIELMGV